MRYRDKRILLQDAARILPLRDIGQIWGNLHAYLVNAAACDGQPMERSALYPSLSNLMLIHLRRDRRLSWPAQKIRIKNFESGSTRHPRRLLRLRCYVPHWSFQLWCVWDGFSGISIRKRQCALRLLYRSHAQQISFVEWIVGDGNRGVGEN